MLMSKWIRAYFHNFSFQYLPFLFEPLIKTTNQLNKVNIENINDRSCHKAINIILFFKFSIGFHQKF